MLVLDVDGVMTDGGIYVHEDGREIKRYDVTDGFGLRVWMRLGLQSAVITGRGGGTVEHRCRQLGIPHVFLDVPDKGAALADLARRTQVAPADMAFLADDWPDLPALTRVGYPMAVANARPEVKALARHVTSAAGGRGAVREAVEHLLSALGRLDEARALYGG